MLLAAEHALVRRRHLLAEYVRVQAPAARFVQRSVALLEAAERCPLRLVDLRHARAAREHRDFSGARVERLAGVVERRRAHAEHANTLSLQRNEIDAVRGMEHACAATVRVEGLEFRPA